ncbi:MAG: cobyric acid synthase [Gemmatimonadetes bacterium]|nr:cobyric acid synthase [Gemmatimonadota bacterium]
MNALMIQGTASGVGKSLLTAGLCRLLARSGVKVAPFKPQNMSNASSACPSGGEIGRAQALQAFASGIEPTVDMNPVLIKPEADNVAQLVVGGKVRGKLLAGRFKEDRGGLMPEVLAAFDRLRHAHDWVVVEGAGSPAEPNLREGDIANMGFARAAGIPVWLVGDIDRGGVFAALLGTMEALEADDRRLVEAIIVNRFRGEASLLGDVFQWLEGRTGTPVLGWLPYFQDLGLPEEDSPYTGMDRSRRAAKPGDDLKLRVAGIHYPRASNTTDLDPFLHDPGVVFTWLRDPSELTGPHGWDLVVLPGSKSTAADLAWLRERGWPAALERHLRYGGCLLGICGGAQMLGKRILDPREIEGPVATEGLAWLPIETEMQPDKRVHPLTARAKWPADMPFSGYEIRHGQSSEDPDLFPFCARSEDGRVMGTFIHGLFDDGKYRGAVLESWLNWTSSSEEHVTARWTRDLDRIADAMAENLDLSLLAGRIGINLG